MTMPKAYWLRLPVLKKLLIQKYGKICQKCTQAFPKKSDMVVHHLSYKNIGNEKIDEDVTLLCHACHKATHMEKSQ